MNFANKLNFKKKNIIITGCSGYLGKNLFSKLKKLGANCIGIDTNVKKHKSFFSCDIGNTDQVKKVFKKIYLDFGTVDILINNAAVSIFTPFDKRTKNELELTTNTNLHGTINCINSFINFIDKKKKNKIVNVSSVYSIISPDPKIYEKGDKKNSEIYGATKAGINQLTKYYSIHLSKYNVNINSISPGGIFNEENPQKKEFVKKYSKKNPMGRMAKVDEISDLIILLSSKYSDYINGHNLVVDGGMSSW